MLVCPVRQKSSRIVVRAARSIHQLAHSQSLAARPCGAGRHGRTSWPAIFRAMVHGADAGRCKTST